MVLERRLMTTTMAPDLPLTASALPTSITNTTRGEALPNNQPNVLQYTASIHSHHPYQQQANTPSSTPSEHSLGHTKRLKKTTMTTDNPQMDD